MTTSAPYVSKKLRECDLEIAAAIPRVIASSDDEAIHDLRVGIRRLRTLLKMSRKIFGRWHADAVRGAYADVQRATGELRDEEVLEETLEAALTRGGESVPEDTSLAAFLAARRTRERKLRRAVVARLERGDLDRARLMLKALLVFPVSPKKDEDLARFARRTVERARRGVESRRDVAPEDVAGLHELRIAYKELRYSIELLADALPIDARALLEPATVFQKRLGEIHDSDVAIDVIGRAHRIHHGTREGVLASLAAARAKRLGKYLRELDPLGQSSTADRTEPEIPGDPAEGRSPRQEPGEMPEKSPSDTSA